MCMSLIYWNESEWFLSFSFFDVSYSLCQEYDETMDHLQSDIESLETEKGELREKLKALNKKTLYDALSKSSPLTGNDTSLTLTLETSTTSYNWSKLVTF